MTRQSALLELRPSRFRLPRQLSLLFFPRAKDGLADTPHRSLRYFSRPLGTFVDHLEHARRMPLELHATLPHRPDPFNQMVRHLCFALDAADRKSTRLNSSHGYISYAVFCLNKQEAEMRCVTCRVT